MKRRNRFGNDGGIVIVAAIFIAILVGTGYWVMREAQLAKAQIIYKMAGLIKDPLLCKEMPVFAQVFDGKFAVRPCEFSAEVQENIGAQDYAAFLKALGLSEHFQKFAELPEVKNHLDAVTQEGTAIDPIASRAQTPINQQPIDSAWKRDQYLQCSLKSGFFQDHLRLHFKMALGMAWGIGSERHCAVEYFTNIGRPEKPSFLSETSPFYPANGLIRSIYPMFDLYLPCDSLWAPQLQDLCNLRAAAFRPMLKAQRTAQCAEIGNFDKRQFCQQYVDELK